MPNNWDLPAELTVLNRWLLVIGKKFVTPWKTESDIFRHFLPFEQAVTEANEAIAYMMQNYPDLYKYQDPQVALAVCIRGTGVACVDIDVDRDKVAQAKRLGKFRYGDWGSYLSDDKKNLLDHCLSHYHCRYSTNGGLHALVRSCDLPSGSFARAEVKTNGTLFLCHKVASLLPIVEPQPELRQLIGIPDVVKQRTVSTSTTQERQEATAVLSLPNKNQVCSRLNYFAKLSEQGLGSLLDSHNNEDQFFYVMKCLVGIVSVDDFTRWCKTQPYRLKFNQSYDQYFKAVRNRFASLKPHLPVESQVRQFVALCDKRQKYLEGGACERRTRTGSIQSGVL